MVDQPRTVYHEVKDDIGDALATLDLRLVHADGTEPGKSCFGFFCGQLFEASKFWHQAKIAYLKAQNETARGQRDDAMVRAALLQALPENPKAVEAAAAVLAKLETPGTRQAYLEETVVAVLRAAVAAVFEPTGG